MRALIATGIAFAMGASAPTFAATTATQRLTDASQERGAFVSVAPAARPVGMGEAFTAVADDASAVSWNPGGLGQLGGLGLVAMYNALDAGAGLTYLATALPLGPGVAGLGLTALTFGSYDVRDASGLKTGLASENDVAITGSYAVGNPAWLGGAGWTGLSVEVVNEAVGAPLVGFGAGSLVPVASQVNIGWSVQHLGPKSNAYALPAAVRGGIAWLVSPGFRLAGDAGYLLVSRQPLVAGGVEASLFRVLAIRAGYKYIGASADLGGLTGVTAGLGVRIGRFGVDYAYQPFGDLAVSHRVALVYGLGTAEPGQTQDPGAPTTTIVEVPKTSSAVLYKRAVAQFKAGKIDEAIATLRVVVRQSPEHWQAWQLAGSCLAKKGEDEKAVQAMRQSLKLHPDNPKLRKWLEEHP